MLAPAALSPAALAFPGIKAAELDHTVLAAIINAKVAMLQAFVPAALPDHLPPCRNLAQALSGAGRHFILECKRASPSLGDINLELDFKAQAAVYNRHAAAISVLTESSVFKGSYEFLAEVKTQTHLPVILKDFVIDAREVINARAIGADALLLMTSVLTEEKFMELYTLAYKLGLEVLCEVSTPDEADFARRMELQIVGINNRDLKTLQIDLNTARTLAPQLSARSIIVSESGIKRHQDLLALKPLNNFLIGSAVCADTSRAEETVRSLLYGRNKICGLTTKEAVQAAALNKAALGGLIFAPKSPRCVSLEQAGELCAVGKPLGLTFCGVFVDAPEEEVVNTVQALQLPYVQLHGSESPDYIHRLQERLPGVGFIKAVPVSDASFTAYLKPYQDAGLNLTFLFDSKTPGSGRAFDHRLLCDVDKSRALLSGGIGPDNLQNALQQGFAGLDLNSRLESAPGVKDPALIAAALQQINAF